MRTMTKETVEVAKAVEAQEKAEARPPPWRDKKADQANCCRTEEAARQEERTAEKRGESFVVAYSLAQRRKAAIQEGVKNFHLCFQHFR